MINVGINGLGRIAKSLLVQCVRDKNIKINAINVPDYNINTIVSYLTHDSIHKETIKKEEITIIDEHNIAINNNWEPWSAPFPPSFAISPSPDKQTPAHAPKASAKMLPRIAKINTAFFILFLPV